ncbi:hypothetical protein AWC02_05600 [Mycolicibacter engbaekii]|uniref:Uncharacterized protein n=1 Tax=Mycolicibacter engbaekii TaxID=188915 RepID=A0A1X1TZP2_9MYCO|nr:hypothetical protein [Mycolicibacter engbaekii]ORV50046.1 hypothetical protein AWC02_05600 [Mycolicibacter engbaekii]
MSLDEIFAANGGLATTRQLLDVISIDWHMGPKALLHYRLKVTRLQECGWLSVPMTVSDVRGDPAGLVGRIAMYLDQRLPG